MDESSGRRRCPIPPRTISGASLRPHFPTPPGEKAPPDLKRPERIETALVIAPTSDEEGLNQLERAWLRELRQRPSDWLGIQPVGFKLASHRTRYHPDFVTLSNGRLTAWECKGPQFWDDAKVKLKVAARQYPFIRFVLVKRQEGRWIELEIKP